MDGEECKLIYEYDIFELWRKIWRCSWSSQLCTQLKQLWNLSLKKFQAWTEILPERESNRRSRWVNIGQVLFFMCLWTETKLRSINIPNKTMTPISSHLDEQVWSVKDLLPGKRTLPYLQGTASNPTQARWQPIKYDRIWFTLPTQGDTCSHVIK